jgi:anti-sigma factor RsiW
MKGSTLKMPTEPEDVQIVAYLLGELSEDDRTRLEERFLQDADYRELIRAVEDDLIDDYVHDELAPHQRALFEKYFTSVPHRRQKVELAKALSRHLSGRQVRVVVPRSSNPALKFALAAGIVLFLAFGAWFMTRTVGPRTDPERSQVEQPQPQGPTPAPPAERPRENQPIQPPATSPTPLVTATFVLPPGLTRESRQQSRAFALPSGTQLVQFRLPLEKGDEYPAFRADLRTASGDPIWQSGVVPPESTPAGQSVVLQLPADLLRSEKYELRLTAIDKEVAEDLGYYYFSVVKN